VRLHPSISGFARFCGVSGLGVYVGTAIAGLIAVLTGRVFAAGATWLATVPVLAVVGAGVGVLVGRLTRRWLLPRVPARRWTFLAAGAVTLPLFTAVGQPGALGPPGAVLALAGGCAMLVVYWRSARTSRPVRTSSTGAGTR
jgi:hypothetical protein